jgi:hypothetical protein
MFMCSWRLLVLLVFAATTLWLCEESPASAAVSTCNGQAAVTIGCPIPQQSCISPGCGNILTPCTSCWSVTKVYSNLFGCGALTLTQRTLSNNWLCYQVWDVGPLGLMPVTASCLDIQYCKKMGFICVPDQNGATATLNSQIYGSTNNCQLPS